MFKYDPNISLGTIVETVMLTGLVIGCYVALVGNDVRHDERIAANAQIVDTVRGDLKEVLQGNKQIQQDINSIKIEQARVQQQLTNVRTK